MNNKPIQTQAQLRASVAFIQGLIKADNETSVERIADRLDFLETALVQVSTRHDVLLEILDAEGYVVKRPEDFDAYESWKNSRQQ